MTYSWEHKKNRDSWKLYPYSLLSKEGLGYTSCLSLHRLTYDWLKGKKGVTEYMTDIGRKFPTGITHVWGMSQSLRQKDYITKGICLTERSLSLYQESLIKNRSQKVITRLSIKRLWQILSQTQVWLLLAFKADKEKTFLLLFVQKSQSLDLLSLLSWEEHWL